MVAKTRPANGGTWMWRPMKTVAMECWSHLWCCNMISVTSRFQRFTYLNKSFKSKPSHLGRKPPFSFGHIVHETPPGKKIVTLYIGYNPLCKT